MSTETEKQQHTPGPWICCDAKGKFLGGKSKWRADYSGKANIATSSPIMFGKETIAIAVDTGLHDGRLIGNLNLISGAPASDLLLKMLMLGRARFETATKEFCFDGLRYSVRDGNWNAIVGLIGWDKCRDAAAKGPVQP